MNGDLKQKFSYQFLRLITYGIVISVGYILFDIIRHGLPVISWDFLTGFPRHSGSEGGILPAILGTVYLTVGTIAVALPLGVGCAIYLSEYAERNRFSEIVRLAIITLAGVPSIVYGLFGLGLFVIFCPIRHLDPGGLSHPGLHGPAHHYRGQ